MFGGWLQNDVLLALGVQVAAVGGYLHLEDRGAQSVPQKQESLDLSSKRSRGHLQRSNDAWLFHPGCQLPVALGQLRPVPIKMAL